MLHSWDQKTKQMNRMWSLTLTRLFSCIRPPIGLLASSSLDNSQKKAYQISIGALPIIFSAAHVYIAAQTIIVGDINKRRQQ